jgi:hypothetical protein
LRDLNHQLRVRFPIAPHALTASSALLLMPAHGSAGVEISCHTHEFGADFPHAYAVLGKSDDRPGQRIDANYGFTATHVDPATWFGAVNVSAAHRST